MQEVILAFNQYFFKMPYRLISTQDPQSLALVPSLASFSLDVQASPFFSFSKRGVVTHFESYSSARPDYDALWIAIHRPNTLLRSLLGNITTTSLYKAVGSPHV